MLILEGLCPFRRWQRDGHDAKVTIDLNERMDGVRRSGEVGLIRKGDDLKYRRKTFT